MRGVQVLQLQIKVGGISRAGQASAMNGTRAGQQGVSSQEILIFQQGMTIIDQLHDTRALACARCHFRSQRSHLCTSNTPGASQLAFRSHAAQALTFYCCHHKNRECIQ